MSRLDNVIRYGEDQVIRKEGTLIPGSLYFRIHKRTQYSGMICQAYQNEIFGVWLPKFLEKL